MQNVTTISPKCASIHSSRHASPHIQDIPCITVGTRHQRDTPTDHHCPQILITLLFCQLSKLMDFFSVHPHYCLFPLVVLHVLWDLNINTLIYLIFLMYWFTFFINNLIDWNFHISNVCSLSPKQKMMILFSMWNLLLEMCNLLLPKNLGTKR